MIYCVRALGASVLLIYVLPNRALTNIISYLFVWITCCTVRVTWTFSTSPWTLNTCISLFIITCFTNAWGSTINKVVSFVANTSIVLSRNIVINIVTDIAWLSICTIQASLNTSLAIVIEGIKFLFARANIAIWSKSSLIPTSLTRLSIITNPASSYAIGTRIVLVKSSIRTLTKVSIGFKAILSSTRITWISIYASSTPIWALCTQLIVDVVSCSTLLAIVGRFKANITVGCASHTLFWNSIKELSFYALTPHICFLGIL